MPLVSIRSPPVQIEDMHMTTQVEPLTISVAEAARRLGISRDNAYTQAREGRLPTVRIGHRILVPVKKLESLVNGETIGAGK